MKKFVYVFLLTIPLFISWFCTSSSAGKEKQLLKNEQPRSTEADFKNIAVLELFTSQGCSSCPPADKLFGTYISKENIIALSFHVDYWNRLGWKDPFSSKEYSQRQYNYSSTLNAGIYTPQLVINGQSEMIGSDENKISNTLKKTQSQQPVAELCIKNIKPENGKASISFDASGNTGNSVLNIAIVQKKITTDIKAGENGGVTLTNYNVVRNFKTIQQFKNGDNTCDINIPPGIDLNNISVVLFLQEKGDNKILAAGQKSF